MRAPTLQRAQERRAAEARAGDAVPIRRRRERYRLSPLMFSGVVIVLFGLFFVWPAGLGIWYSFTDYNGVGAPEFIGLGNYLQLLQDPAFWSALTRTALYAAVSVPLGFVVPLLLAVLLTSPHAKGKSAARVVIFLPWLVSPIVAGVVWRWLFGENFGFVNYLIEVLGGSALPWSSNAELSLAVVVFAAVWGTAAFNMLLFVAAIRNVPASQYEAASLDGAGPWQRFWYITLPGIAPTSFLVVLLSLIASMKEFAMIQALNGGGPGTSNRLMVQYIYETGFARADVGYASAASIVLMMILLVIAVIQLRFERRGNQS